MQGGSASHLRAAPLVHTPDANTAATVTQHAHQPSVVGGQRQLCLLCCRLVPNQPASLEALRKLGVLYWKLDADNHETDPRLAAIRKVRGYSYVVRGSALRFAVCKALRSRACAARPVRLSSFSANAWCPCRRSSASPRTRCPAMKTRSRRSTRSTFTPTRKSASFLMGQVRESCGCPADMFAPGRLGRISSHGAGA